LCAIFEERNTSVEPSIINDDYPGDIPF
jgi:hypothetical protein